MSRNWFTATALFAAAPALVLGLLGALAATFPSWSTKAPMPTARGMVGVGSALGKVYAIGGYVGGQARLGTVEEYDPMANSWSARASIPTPRAGLGVAVLETKPSAAYCACRSSEGMIAHVNTG